MKRTLATLVAAGLILPIVGWATAAQLQAQADPLTAAALLAQGGPGGPAGRTERLIEELDLTDTQVAQIRAIREAERDEMQALHESLWTERQTLHDLMAGDATAADLRAQHEEIQTLHREVADQRFENMLAVRQVLTPEQRAELGELMEQRRENRRQERGFFRGGERRGDRR